jgi:ATP-dependent 26S proteasome regulatory subunit
MFGPRDAPLSFHERPALTRDGLVLPANVLEVVEAQVIGIARHRSRLVASGQHLKRGVLLHGPPGTGKTHTLRYLMSRLTDATVVMLSGNALQFIAPAVSIARALQPALVIVEDVDLIAEQRGMHPGQHPLLFQLLNEIDGLGEDADVTFLLTTNRADLLEPALAQRPGRVDQAVELPLPDAEGRRRLLALYRGSLDLELVDIEPIVAKTEGVTASFFKELLRRAALLSAERAGADGQGALAVGDAELQAALDQLLAQGNQLTRVLLGASRDDDPPDP